MELISIEDRFNIISNNINLIDIDNIDKHIKAYLLSSININISSILHQISYSKQIYKIDNDKIKTVIISHLISERNNIRKNIRLKTEDSSILTYYIELLKTIIPKLEYINILFDINVNDELNNFIIFDTIFLVFIEKIIIKFDINLKSDLELMLSIISNYEQSVCDKFINKISEILININVINSGIPLNKELLNIKYFNDYIIYYNNVVKYYDFKICNKLNLTPLYNNIINYLSNIIVENSSDDIEFIFNVFGNNIKGILNEINDLHIQQKQLFNLILNKFNSTNFISLLNSMLYLNIYVVREVLHKHIIDNNYGELLINYIDSIIIKNMFNKVYDNIIIKLLKILYLSNNEEINNYYCKALIKRLLIFYNNNNTDFNIHINNEQEYCKEITKNKYNYKLTKIIDDIQLSYELKIKSNFPEVNIIIITQIWEINMINGNFKIDNNSLLFNYIEYYDHYYKLLNSDNHIIWLPHFGEIIISYLNITITMFPIHFLILELFNETNVQHIGIIYNNNLLLNYDNKFKINLINSFLISKLLILNNSNLELSNTNIFLNNLIEIFLNKSNEGILNETHINELIHGKNTQELDKNIISYTKKEIISCNINQLLKLEDLDYYILLNKLQKIITITEFNESDFKISLDYMIKMDYITTIQYPNNVILYKKIDYKTN